MLTAMTGRATASPARPAVVHHSSQGMFAIRQGEWKLIEGRGSGGFTEPRKITAKPGEPAGELYNLFEDPSEADNRYLRESARVAELTNLLNQYRRQNHSRPM
jgi:arylsulfatase A-like enzyme